MSKEDLAFTAVILLGALYYIYKTLFKKSDCGNCACSGKKEKTNNKCN